MDLNMNDLMALKALDGKSTDMSSYEHFMLAEKTSHRPSNAAVTGVVLGAGGLVVGIAAWIASSTYAHARSNGNAALILANQTANRDLATYMVNALATERNMREGQAITLTNYLQGSQQGSQTTTAESNAISQATAQIAAGVMTGQYQMAPQEVTLVSKKYCPCPCGNE